MAQFSFIFGIIGNVISILMFASPIGTFRRVVKRKSTEDYVGIPYITTLLSTTLWTFYGLLKPGGLLVVTVNGVGAILQFVYVSLFIIYAPKDTKIKTLKLAAILNIGFFGSVVVVTLLAFHGSGQLLFVGVICAALTIGMYASPLSVMRTVVKTRSVEYMPFSLSFFQCLNGAVWAVYSALVRDYFIGVPNAIGFALGSAQLIIYAMYKNKSPTEKSKDEREEESNTHLVKGRIEMQDLCDDYNNDVEAQNTTHKLHRVRSLPVPSQQLNFQRLLKTISLSPHELSVLAAEHANKD